MKLNKWTLALSAAGVVSLGSIAQAEEAQHQVLTALTSTTLSGYVDTSAIWRPGTGNLTGAGAFTGGNKQDGINLNVVKLTLEKPLDEGQWSAGYKVDLLFGPDATGFNSSANSAGTADFSVKQAYVALRAPVGNGIDIKIGTFDTVIGYEVFESPNNPNYSRSYGWAMEPTQHTGVLASYRFADWFSASAGIADTWTAGINDRAANSPGGVKPFASESEKTYMGSITLTAPDSFGALKGAVLYGGIVNGLPGRTSSSAGSEKITSLYAGVTVPTPVTGLTVGAAYDYRGTDHSDVPLVASSWANAAALYTSYQATEKLKFNLRGEYASANLGTLAAMSGSPTSIPAPGDHQDQVLAATITADYSLWANVISRVELRWDHDLSRKADGTLFDTRAGNTGGGVGGNKNLYTLALNLIYKF